MAEIEKAREYAGKCALPFVSPDLSRIILDMIIKAYIAGATENGIVWHDLRKNPNDLPNETGLLMSKTLLLVTKMKGSDCLSLALGQYNFSIQEFSYQHIVGLTDIIAWCEIPQFMDED